MDTFFKKKKKKKKSNTNIVHLLVYLRIKLALILAYQL